MTRTAARRLAVQLSFASSSGSDLAPAEFFDEEYFRALPPEGEIFEEMPDEAQMTYIRSLVDGVNEHRAELDEYISRYSRGWKISRISRTALAVLRCAMYEILYMEDIPQAASINEAVELAKSFDEAETVSFINGILGSFVREREM
ncbi:MAG: transcription antitermination factor NusB [Oscillospiraceae bacterium]|nr:transcription antitermination factor NusB [Oscillospiraceae bacterium]